MEAARLALPILPKEVTDEDAVAFLATFDDDPIQAIRSLLQSLSNQRRNTSYGYMYGAIDVLKLPQCAGVRTCLLLHPQSLNARPRAALDFM